MLFSCVGLCLVVLPMKLPLRCSKCIATCDVTLWGACSMLKEEGVPLCQLV